MNFFFGKISPQFNDTRLLKKIYLKSNLVRNSNSIIMADYDGSFMKHPNVLLNFSLETRNDLR